MLRAETIREAPKAMLHDHLDGGLRPSTIVDLAAEFGYDGLPTADPDELATHIRRGADRKSLELYLETFQHTVGVMQEKDAIIRVAAECAVRWRDAGVVGFDIAGPEAGYRPTQHLDAFEYVRRENFHTTIHAGEAFGLPSIWEAVQFCGAERLGHGVRIVDDITGPPGEEELGRLADFVRDRRIPLELCPTSNIGTGVCKTVAEHPIGMLRRLRFRVTVNTDNRLMSATSMTYEMEQLREAFGWGLDDFEWLTVNAMKSAFAPFPERLRIINGIVKPRYALAKAEQSVGLS